MSPLLNELTILTLKVLAIFSVLLGLFSVMTYLERRVLAFMQFRLGPNRTGPFGLLQPVADGIKLFFKEEVVPAGANRWLFIAAPGLSVVAAFMAVAVVPFGGSVRILGRDITLQIADLDVGVLYLFAVSALGVYGIVLAGWSANNKYALLGGLRSAAQMFSYELPLGLSFLGVILLAGSLRIPDIVTDQAGWFWNWNAAPHRQLLAFVIYLVAATAEINRIPFDLPESEAELVAGFHTEYSSMRFALLQMAEYINMITVAALGTNLFLGGGSSGLPFLSSQGFFGVIWFGFKVLALLFLFIWLRGTLPRIRYDQLMRLGWKVLLPLAALNILVTAGFVAVHALHFAGRP